MTTTLRRNSEILAQGRKILDFVEEHPELGEIYSVEVYDMPRVRMQIAASSWAALLAWFYRLSDTDIRTYGGDSHYNVEVSGDLDGVKIAVFTGQPIDLTDEARARFEHGEVTVHTLRRWQVEGVR